MDSKVSGFLSYHRFPNFREKLKNDLTTKIVRGVFDKDHKNDDCNCTAPSLQEGTCIYGGKCRQSTIIYSLKCKICDMIYVGKSQQHFKQRTQQHMGEAWKHARAMKGSTDMRIGKMLEVRVAPMHLQNTSEATYAMLATLTKRELSSRAFLIQQFYGKETESNA